MTLKNYIHVHATLEKDSWENTVQEMGFAMNLGVEHKFREMSQVI